jgi:hypothetical protein
MKKLLLILLCLPLLFNSCKKEEEDNPNSPFIGYWSGTYSGDDASGFWNGTISSNGEINGEASSVDLPEGVDLSGTVTNSGDFTAIIGTGSLGINFIGQLSGNSGSGTWSSSTSGWTGTWEGHNYNQ